MYEKEEILAEADRISERIKDLDTVKDYHNVESQIHQNKNIRKIIVFSHNQALMMRKFPIISA